MVEQVPNYEWQELKEIWKNSSQTRVINIQMSKLVTELKGKVSQFEKDSIKSDVAQLKANWDQFIDKASQFEKRSINHDLKIITRALKRFLNLLRKKS